MPPDPSPEETPSPSPPAPPGKQRTFLLVLLLVLVIGLALYREVSAAFTPANPNGHPVTVTIPAGFSARRIATLLQEQGILQDRTIFLVLSLIEGRRSLKAGEYLLSPAMTPYAILRLLREGKVILHPIVVPEGFTMNDIGAALEKAGITSKQAFLRQANNPELMKELGVPADRAEGYLFPDTYFFAKGTPPRVILRRMVQNFWRRFTPDLRALAAARHMSVHQVVTLASIVEKEAKEDWEKPLIAAVFLNRLKDQMLLQADPTVIYCLPHFDGNIRKEDLQVDSPYNTYRYPGLPPGPIASPGIASLRAVLHPAPVSYLYFVSMNNGEHHFSYTLEEHDRAVRKYQLDAR